MANKIITMKVRKIEQTREERLEERIVQIDGVPYIRGTQLTIWSLLEMIGHGETEEKMRSLMPTIEPGDFRLACLAASRIGYVGTTDYNLKALMKKCESKERSPDNRQNHRSTERGERLKAGKIVSPGKM